jgi:O-acetyl-ADP-ribose deacetylase (regulator of RNase III)
MITFTTGNLLEANVDAIVNTVNTVGIMGKGIALMFKDAFPENFKKYEEACKSKNVVVGRMFITKREELFGPKWIINFPTKSHWRNPSKIQWIEDGLNDLKLEIKKNNIKSIAIPPLGAGNGGLNWADVKTLIQSSLGALEDVDIVVYEPTSKYQNVAKRQGVEKLTPARGLIAELIRQYSIMGIECTLLEVQKLGYFLERQIVRLNMPRVNFQFAPNKFGPYSNPLSHMLNALDGSYIHSDKRLADASRFDVIRFDFSKTDTLKAYLTSPDVKQYHEALETTSNLIDGFESPMSMELLATVDWLVSQNKISPDIDSVRTSLKKWPAGNEAGERKYRLFDERLIEIALKALTKAKLINFTH